PDLLPAPWPPLLCVPRGSWLGTLRLTAHRVTECDGCSGVYVVVGEALAAVDFDERRGPALPFGEAHGAQVEGVAAGRVVAVVARLVAAPTLAHGASSSRASISRTTPRQMAASTWRSTKSRLSSAVQGLSPRPNVYPVD